MSASGGFMSKVFARVPVFRPVILIGLLSCALLLSGLCQTTTNADVHRPLRASEVMAIQAGGALPANIGHDVAIRGLTFHPDDEFLALMTNAGADAAVIAALKTAKVNEDRDAKADIDLLRKLSDAAALMKSKKYDDAVAKLSDALDTSFARIETGFVMAELLRQRVQFATSAAV